MPANAGPFGFGPVVDGVNLPSHPFDPTAPAISGSKPLMVGWNEDEYTFFAWQMKDTSAIGIDWTGLEEKLKAQYGPDTEQILETYRRTMPDALANGYFCGDCLHLDDGSRVD